MEASSQPHASAALHPGKQPLVPLTRRLGGPRSRSGGSGEEKIVLPLPGFKPCVKTVLQIHIWNTCNFLKVPSTQFTVKTPHLQLCITFLSRCQHVWYFTTLADGVVLYSFTVELLWPKFGFRVVFTSSSTYKNIYWSLKCRPISSSPRHEMLQLSYVDVLTSSLGYPDWGFSVLFPQL
jgi:hypothetical protein